MSATPCEFSTVRDLSEDTFTYGYTLDGTPLDVTVAFVSTIEEEQHQDLVGSNQVRVALKYASCVEFYFTEETANEIGKSQDEAFASGNDTLTITYPDDVEFGFDESQGGLYDPSDSSSLSEETWGGAVEGITKVADFLIPKTGVFELADYADSVVRDTEKDRAAFQFDQKKRIGLAQYFYFDVEEGSSPFDITVRDAITIQSVDNHPQDTPKQPRNEFTYTVVP